MKYKRHTWKTGLTLSDIACIESASCAAIVQHTQIARLTRYKLNFVFGNKVRLVLVQSSWLAILFVTVALLRFSGNAVNSSLTDSGEPARYCCNPIRNWL